MTMATVRELLKAREAGQWDLGDALTREIQTGKDWETLMDWVNQEGLDFTRGTLKAYHRVAHTFRPQDRVAGASFAAHQAALTAGSLAGAKTALQNAQASGAKVTRDKVLSQVRQMKGRATHETSDVLAAWRDLRRATQSLLDADAADLRSLLMLEGGKYQAEAAELGSKLVQTASRIADASAEVERKAKGKSKSKTPAQAQAPTAKPKIRKLGAGRGEA